MFGHDFDPMLKIGGLVPGAIMLAVHPPDAKAGWKERFDDAVQLQFMIGQHIDLSHVCNGRTPIDKDDPEQKHNRRKQGQAGQAQEERHAGQGAKDE